MDIAGLYTILRWMARGFSIECGCAVAHQVPHRCRVALAPFRRYLYDMQKLLPALLIMLVFCSAGLRADDEDTDAKKNCKITVRKKMKSGKTKLEILTVATATREECKLQAEDQKKAMDEDVASVKTSFGFTQ